MFRNCIARYGTSRIHITNFGDPRKFWIYQCSTSKLDCLDIDQELVFIRYTIRWFLTMMISHWSSWMRRHSDRVRTMKLQTLNRFINQLWHLLKETQNRERLSLSQSIFHCDQKPHFPFNMGQQNLFNWLQNDFLKIRTNSLCQDFSITHYAHRYERRRSTNDANFISSEQDWISALSKVIYFNQIIDGDSAFFSKMKFRSLNCICLSYNIKSHTLSFKCT